MGATIIPNGELDVSVVSRRYIYGRYILMVDLLVSVRGKTPNASSTGFQTYRGVPHPIGGCSTSALRAVNRLSSQPLIHKVAPVWGFVRGCGQCQGGTCSYRTTAALFRGSLVVFSCWRFHFGHFVCSVPGDSVSKHAPGSGSTYFFVDAPICTPPLPPCTR